MRIRAIQSACTQGGWRSGPISRTASVFITVLFLSGGAVFAEEPVAKAYEIAAQSVSTALKVFAAQSDMQLIFTESDVGDVRTAGINGNMTPREALIAILKGTDLEFEFTENNVIVVRKPKGGTEALANSYFASPGEGRPDPGNGRTMSPEGAVAQASSENSRTTEEESKGGEEQPSDSRERDRRLMEEIIVTGTNIRGIAPESSPIRIFDREDIQISGAGTAQDFIQLLPQNFGGGSNSDLTIGAPNDDNSQLNGVNLGGTLGSSVNLRGLGSGSTLVLLNGHRLAPSSGIGDFTDISMIPASAIERVEVLTDGASSIYGGDAVAGVVNIVLQDDFDGAEASFRSGTVTEGDLSEFRTSFTGGKNWDTGSALLVYEYFNQDNLSVDDRSFSRGAPLPNDLLPSQERHSVLASGTQEVTQNLKMSSNFIFSRREAGQNSTNSSGITSNRAASSESLNISAGGSWNLFDSWFIDFSGTYSDLHNMTKLLGETGESNRVIDSDIWTVELVTSGTIFQLPGGDVKLALGGHYREEEFTNFNVISNATDREADREIYAFFGEALIPIVGANNAISGVDRLEFNVSGRFDDYSDFGSTANPKIGVLWSPVDGLRLRSSYSTSFKPPPLGRVGATDLNGFAVRTSLLNSVLGLTPGDASIADVVEFVVLGTSKNLGAETSTAITAGLDFNKRWGRHTLTFATTYFDIEFENRLGATPIPGSRRVFDAPNIAFDNPELFPTGTVIFLPTQNQISDILDDLDTLSTNFGEDPLDAEIINLAGVVRNLSLTNVTGVDFDLSYKFEPDTGTFTLGIDGTYLADFQQQAAVTTPIVDQINTLFNPVDLRLRGRAGYKQNGLSANIFINYADNYRVDNTVGSMPIDSWTTVDLSLSFDTKENLASAILDNVMMRLSVLNLFDEAPPSTPSNVAFGIFAFDPTNASPLGRFLAFELTKRF